MVSVVMLVASAEIEDCLMVRMWAEGQNNQAPLAAAVSFVGEHDLRPSCLGFVLEVAGDL